MYWRWGNYIFPPDAVNHQTEQELLLSPAGLPYAEKKSITLEGTLFGNGQVDLSIYQGYLIAACDIQYMDLVLHRNDGGIAMALRSAGSTTGVRRISGPQWTGSGAQYSTFLTFSGLRFEAEYPLPVGDVLLEWTETYRAGGGGPRYAYMQPPRGRPIRWRPYEQSLYWAQQSGRATGMYSRPVPPPPLYPLFLVEGPEIGKTSPTRVNNTFQRFTVEWAYRFESADPLDGEPTAAG